MEVREASAKYLRATGYRQTEVGVIPEDWDVVPLGKRLRRPPTYGINAPAIPFDSRYPTYLRITDITEDGRFAEATKASVDHAASAAYVLEPGDLVFARTGASVGKSYLYNPKDGRLVFAGFLIRITPDPERLVPEFLSFFVQTRTYWSWVKVNSMRSGQPGINGREYASLPIPLPSTKAEQEAIAEALSDADALIESLAQLLAKKRHLKQGAMQQLLTGNKRLPGFSGEWEVKRLGDISPLQRGFDLPTTQIRLGRYPVVYSNGVLNYHDQFMVKGPGVVTGRSGTIGNVHFVEDDYWPHNTSLWVTSFTGNSPRFIYYFLTYIGLERFGTGSGVPTLNRNDVHAYKVHIPPTTEEQTAIATILSDMDAELAALEEKLAKARAVKQGMMQELLTGRIRLV
jgi:type I restriction enzyme S subunit